MAYVKFTYIKVPLVRCIALIRYTDCIGYHRLMYEHRRDYRALYARELRACLICLVSQQRPQCCHCIPHW